MDKFIYKDSSYFIKFDKKVEFIKEHVSELAVFFKEKDKVDLDTKKIVVSFITYAPNISRYYMPKYKCMSISEFEVEWKENPWQFMIEIGKDSH